MRKILTHTALGIMTSPNSLLPVIYDLGLDKAWANRIDKSDSDDLPPRDALLPQEALAYMSQVLKLNVEPGTNIVDITASSDVPKEAADIANDIADRYRTICETKKNQDDRRSTVWPHASRIHILSRAEVPTVPSKPNQKLCFILTILTAGFLGATVSSFVEVILLFLRAAENSDA